jgi:hypothetical protein
MNGSSISSAEIYNAFTLQHFQLSQYFSFYAFTHLRFHGFSMSYELKKAGLPALPQGWGGIKGK